MTKCHYMTKCHTMVKNSTRPDLRPDFAFFTWTAET